MSRTARPRGALIARVINSRLWGDRPFSLLDVGCSGGLDERWDQFGDRLAAVGFDPLIAEIERLNAANVRPGVRYEAAFITGRGYDALFPPELRNDRIASKNNDPFPRVSASAAMHRLQTSYVQEVFNAGAPVVLADRSIALDEYVTDPEARAGVDFVKIDTDGHDIEVVLGSEGIMQAGGFLGISVEAQLHGATHDYANTFSNIDRLLRRQGFTLFDLEIFRYSRTALPAPFLIDLTAQTTAGQMLWGEALYFRDLGSLDYERMWPYEVTPERVMKLACLFDLFDLPDCAAELLLGRGNFLERSVKDELLDLLVTGQPGSYAALVQAFERDFRSFYPSRIEAARQAELAAESAAASAEPPAAPVASRDAAAEVKLLRHQLAKMTEKNAALRERLKTREERVGQLTARVTELKQKLNR